MGDYATIEEGVVAVDPVPAPSEARQPFGHQFPVGLTGAFEVVVSAAKLGVKLVDPGLQACHLVLERGRAENDSVAGQLGGDLLAEGFGQASLEDADLFTEPLVLGFGVFQVGPQ